MVPYTFVTGDLPANPSKVMCVILHINLQCSAAADSLTVPHPLVLSLCLAFSLSPDTPHSLIV